MTPTITPEALADTLRQIADAQYTRRNINGRLPADVQGALRIAADYLAALPELQAAPAAAGAPDVEAAYEMGAKGGPALEAERRAFEAWMNGHCWALCATWNGKGYVSDVEQAGGLCAHASNTRRLWAAWRDRAALGAVAKPAAQPQAEQRGDCGGCRRQNGCIVGRCDMKLDNAPSAQAEQQDLELPGMWERADFMGGKDYESNKQQGEQKGAGQ